MQAAGRDVCHDDSVRLAATARAAGVDVTITEYPDVEHIWILNGSWRLRYGERYPDDGVGSFGWDGGTGTSWRTEPSSGMTAIVLTQRTMDGPQAPPLFRDVWSAAFAVGG